jgi:hypothetical protein
MTANGPVADWHLLVAVCGKRTYNETNIDHRLGDLILLNRDSGNLLASAP